MKALTLTQPYATLSALRLKTIETRSWRTNYRGPLAIHAAAGLGPVGGRAGLEQLCAQPAFFRALEPFFRVVHRNIPGLGFCDTIDVDEIPLGAVVAMCSLTAVWPIVTPRHMGSPDFSQRGEYVEILKGKSIAHDVTGNEFAFGDYTPGRSAWLMDGAQAFSVPIPAKGALGLWEWEPPA